MSVILPMLGAYKHDAYPKRLYSAELGHALWDPTPQQGGGGASQRGIRLGDVGYISGGSWAALFNVHDEAGGRHVTPRAFERLDKKYFGRHWLPRRWQWTSAESLFRRIHARGRAVKYEDLFFGVSTHAHAGPALTSRST
jgi:hypothetical protein